MSVGVKSDHELAIVEIISTKQMINLYLLFILLLPMFKFSTKLKKVQGYCAVFAIPGSPSTSKGTKKKIKKEISRDQNQIICTGTF